MNSITEFKIKIDLTNLGKLASIFVIYPQNLIDITYFSYKIYFWGDPIILNNFYEKNTNDVVQKIIKEIKGHYYFLVYDERLKKLIIGNSFLSILPIYYYQNKDEVIISNNPLYCIEKSSIIVEKRYVLENILFNYPLFNYSCLKNVFLLPTNTFIELTEKQFKIKKHTSLEYFFTKNPLKLKKSLNYIADFFIQTAKDYLPDTLYFNSLTGGFDGRTIASLGLFYNKNFKAYTFGSEDSIDIKIARLLSKEFKIDLVEFILDENYAQYFAFDNGLEFIQNSFGMGSFARAHYVYSAKRISELSDYIVTGNFGSEVFRAAHITGEVISKNLYNLFISKNFDEAIERIELSENWKWLNKESFKAEWNDLKDELFNLSVFDRRYKDFTKNKLFYLVVFEEVFRKYFGAEIINQFKYLRNRTPFIDYQFLTELLKTEVSSVYSRLFENNPFKRYQGQIIYAYIIEKAFSDFLNITTDKGYKPIDVLKFTGKLYITRGYILRKVFKLNQINDPYAVFQSYQKNILRFKVLPILKDFFNEKSIFEGFNKLSKDNTFFIVLSQNWFFNKLLNQK